MLLKLLLAAGLAASTLAQRLTHEERDCRAGGNYKKCPKLRESDENMCQITANYGCQLNNTSCNDEIESDYDFHFEGVEVHAPPLDDFCVHGDPRNGNICCGRMALNGGDCPTEEEVTRAGFVRTYVGSVAIWKLPPGPAPIKCNKRSASGVHYCYNGTKGDADEDVKCLDKGMYD